MLRSNTSNLLVYLKFSTSSLRRWAPRRSRGPRFSSAAQPQSRMGATISFVTPPPSLDSIRPWRQCIRARSALSVTATISAVRWAAAPCLRSCIDPRRGGLIAFFPSAPGSFFKFFLSDQRRIVICIAI